RLVAPGLRDEPRMDDLVAEVELERTVGRRGRGDVRAGDDREPAGVERLPRPEHRLFRGVEAVADAKPGAGWVRCDAGAAGPAGEGRDADAASTRDGFE